MRGALGLRYLRAQRDSVHVVAGRLMVADVDIPGAQPLLVQSMYLHDGHGISAENLDLMASSARLLAQWEGPGLVAADWNMTPMDVASTGLLVQLGAACTIVAPARPTCRTAKSSRSLISLS